MKRRNGYCRNSAYKRIVQRDGERCRDCGETPKYWLDLGQVTLQDGSTVCAVERRVKLELDHVIPAVDGGLSVDDNFALRCRPCHQAKTEFEAAARRRAA